MDDESQKMSSAYDMPTSSSEDENPNNKYSIHFSERSIRQAFIRKVFTLVTIMLLVVTAFCIIPMVSQSFREWVQGAIWLYIVSIIVFLSFSIALTCFPALRRSFPTNIILLSIFTLSAAAMTMFITAYYNVQSVLICLCITSVCSGGIIVFSINTKHDLTSKIGIIFILSLIVISFGLFTLIFTLFVQWYWLNSVYAGLAAFLMMIYLALDIQMLMGGRKLELSPEEHVFAAMQIFLDILNIFLLLLQIFGKR
ncbi:unnamed protein product [Caenorhabditis auriculariae]|uniref:Uncharacterized protein n=1 Tax=Caenorhabditis auriculariae TaxID=2777116 RepID=A0A8S1HNY5_9PELO|nr:unnamed protein product [Caenorhabditis auriculariae]